MSEIREDLCVSNRAKKKCFGNAVGWFHVIDSLVIILLMLGTWEHIGHPQTTTI